MQLNIIFIPLRRTCLTWECRGWTSLFPRTGSHSKTTLFSSTALSRCRLDQRGKCAYFSHFFGKCPYFFNTYLRQMRTFLHICGKCAYFSHICGKSAYFLHFVTNAHIFYIFVANGHIFLTYLWQMRICFTYLRQMLIFLHICRGCSFCFICLDAFIHRKQ